MSKGAPTIFLPTPKRALLLVALFAVVSITLISFRQSPFNNFSRPLWLQQYDGSVAEQMEQCRALLRSEDPASLVGPATGGASPVNMPTDHSIPIIHEAPVLPAVKPAPEDMVEGAEGDNDVNEVSDDTHPHAHAQFHSKPNAQTAGGSSSSVTVPIVDEKSPCNPFLRPGFVYPDGTNTWVPTLPGCPALPASEREGLLEHLRNKRYFFYGDSISRFAARDLCAQLQGRGKWTRFENTPPEYFYKGENQALHSCTIKSLNFTIVNVYTFGLHNWDMPEFPFLSQHVSIKNDTFVHPTKWQFEHRVRSSFEVLNREFGLADFVFVNSGLWDLYYMQKYMVDPANNIPETPEPHWSYLQGYVGRIHSVLDTIRALQSKPSRKIFWLGLHDPSVWEREPDYCMTGYPQELIDRVHISCHAAPRIRALRETQLAVIEEENRQGRNDVQWLPYHRWVRAVDEDKRMRDDIHPSAYTNQLFGMNVMWEAREYDRVNGIQIATPLPPPLQ